jgi:heat shock protein HtpX
MVIGGAGLLGVLAVCVLFLVLTYNSLARLRQNREGAFANVDVQLVHRYDVIPQLVDAAKAYIDRGDQAIEGVVAARDAAFAAFSIDDKIRADKRVSAALSGFKSACDSNPALKASGKFSTLMREIADTENKLAAARRFFNAATKEYNTACDLFPNILFAGMLGHCKGAWFDMADVGVDRDAANRRPRVGAMAVFLAALCCFSTANADGLGFGLRRDSAGYPSSFSEAIENLINNLSTSPDIVPMCILAIVYVCMRAIEIFNQHRGNPAFLWPIIYVSAALFLSVAMQVRCALRRPNDCDIRVPYVGMEAQQRKNRISTAAMFLLYPLFAIAISVFLAFLIGSILWSAAFLAVFVAWYVFSYCGYRKSIDKMTQARPISRDECPRIYNLLENLCISCGMAKMPRLCVIETGALNAFASGIREDDYAITLTTGIIKKLSDNELEGVIAHELSHIRNGDVKLCTLSMVFNGIYRALPIIVWYATLRPILSGNGILALGCIGIGKGKGKGGGATLVGVLAVAAAAWIVLSIINAVTTLMHFAISRKHEYIADAAAAQLTGKPWAIADALKKISRNDYIDGVVNEDIAEMFISNPCTEKSAEEKENGKKKKNKKPQKDGNSGKIGKTGKDGKIGKDGEDGKNGFWNRLFAADSLTSTHPDIRVRIKVLEQFEMGEGEGVEA